jgi:hypothetical protein
MHFIKASVGSINLDISSIIQVDGSEASLFFYYAGSKECTD